MSLLTSRFVAGSVARGMQWAVSRAGDRVDGRSRLPEFVAERADLTIPVSPSAAATVYRAAGVPESAGVHVNFHGGGFVLGQTHGDDPLCRAIAQHAGVIVIDVDYAVAPQHPFPMPVHQAFEVVQWVAAHGVDHGWNGARVSVGGQSAGGALAAAASRQALQAGRPALLLQVLHYPPLDLTVPARAKHSPLAKPRLSPWMGDVFDTCYVPDTARRADPLVSPAAASDTADLRGIAPAVVIAAMNDILLDENLRYAECLESAGALVELIEVPGADHGYDATDDDRARESYQRIASHIATAHS